MSGAMAGLTGGGAADPTAGAAPGGDTDAGTPEDNVICTICSDGQGGFTVFAGDEPEGDSGGGDDGSEDDADLMGPAGDQPAGGGMGGGAGAPQGQPAPDAASALKLVATILQSAGSSASGSPSPDDNFSSGFGGGAAAMPSISQKY